MHAILKQDESLAPDDCAVYQFHIFYLCAFERIALLFVQIVLSSEHPLPAPSIAHKPAAVHPVPAPANQPADSQSALHPQ